MKRVGIEEKNLMLVFGLNFIFTYFPIVGVGMWQHGQLVAGLEHVYTHRQRQKLLGPCNECHKVIRLLWLSPLEFKVPWTIHLWSPAQRQEHSWQMNSYHTQILAQQLKSWLFEVDSLQGNIWNNSCQFLFKCINYILQIKFLEKELFLESVNINKIILVDLNHKTLKRQK